MKYDVRCGACDHTWEHVGPDNKKPAPLCPECGSGFTDFVWLTTPGIPARKWSPYTLLDRPIPEEPKSYSKVTQKKERK